MAIYYVSSTGSDAAAGTLAAPFLTINHALSLCASGDTVKCRGVLSGGGQGTGVFKERVFMDTAGVSLEAYKPATVFETVWVDGDNYVLPAVADATPGGTHSNGGVWLAFNYAGMIELNANNTAVRGIGVRYSRGRGIEFGGVDDTHRTTGNIVEDCKTWSTRHSGLAGKYADNCTVKRHSNKDSGNFAPFRRPTGAGIPNNHGASITFQVMSGGTFEDLESSDGWGEGVMWNNVINFTAKNIKAWDNMTMGIYFNASANFTLDGWYSYYSDTGNSAAGAELQSGLTINREDHKPDWGALENVCHDFKIMNGVSVNCDRGIVLLGGKGLFLFSNIFFYNNTIVRPSKGNNTGVSSAIFVAGVALYSNIRFGNNIVQLTDTATQDPVTAPTDTNVVWLPNAWSEQPVAAARNSSDIYGNLLLVNQNAVITPGVFNPANYKITGLSPARFSAPRIAAVVNDYFGNVRTAPDSFGFDYGVDGGTPPPPTGNVVTGVTNTISPVTTGNISGTDSNFGGNTTVGALIVANQAATVTSGLAAAAHATMSVGFLDNNGNSAVVGWRARDANATTDNRMIQKTGSVVELIKFNSTNSDHSMTATPIADGIQYNKAAAQTGEANIVASIFGGADVHSLVGTTLVASGIGSTGNIVTPWVPSLMFLMVGNRAFDGTVQNDIRFSFAIATGTGNQNHITFESPHLVTPSDLFERIGTGRIAMSRANGQTHSLTAWGTTSTITSAVATGARTFAWLALKFDSGSVYAGIQTVPTATGNKTFTAVNFKPQLVNMITTLIRTVATDITDSDANALAFGMLSAFVEHSLGYTEMDNQATSDTESIYATKALRMGSVVGTNAALANRTAMLATGPQVNFTTAPATADRQMLMFAIENVSNATVTADFTGTPLTGTASYTVTFTDASTAVDTTITSRSWSFGDGGISTATNPTHAYAVAGTYTVSLTVSNGSINNTKTRTGYVVVSAVPPTPPSNRYVRGAGVPTARITGVKRGAGIKS
jgi:PKD repeat protein